MRRFERLDGSSQRPGAVMGKSQIQPRRIELRVEAERTLVARHRFVVPAKAREHRTQICVRFGVLRFGCDRSPVRFRGALELSLLLGGQTGAERRQGGRILDNRLRGDCVDQENQGCHTAYHEVTKRTKRHEEGLYQRSSCSSCFFGLRDAPFQHAFTVPSGARPRPFSAARCDRRLAHRTSRPCRPATGRRCDRCSLSGRGRSARADPTASNSWRR